MSHTPLYKIYNMYWCILCTYIYIHIYIYNIQYILFIIYIFYIIYIFGIYDISYTRYIYIRYVWVCSDGGTVLGDPDVDDWTMGVVSILERLAPMVGVSVSWGTLCDEKVDHRVSRVYISIYMWQWSMDWINCSNDIRGGIIWGSRSSESCLLNVWFGFGYSK